MTTARQAPGYEQLLANFDLIAEAPGGVAKLRELILQLAVRGKLVEQRPEEGTAEFNREEHEGKKKGERIEGPYPVPQGWRWTTLGAIVEYNYGQKTESRLIPPEAWVLDLEDVEKDTSRVLQRVVAKDRQSASTKTRFVAGDVLYGKLRPYLNKVLVADADGFCTTEIVPMKPGSGVFSEYVVCVLKSRLFLDYTAARSYGMKMPRLGTDDAVRALFPLPPSPEQKRIVAKVDELMKRCDELEARQKERNERHKVTVSSCLHAVTDANKTHPNFILQPSSFNLLFSSPESIAELRRSILNLAIQGKLVGQDPREEPAAQLLSRIQSERNERQTQKANKSLQPLKSVGQCEEPFQVPGNWVWTRLRSLALTLGDGLHGTPVYTDGTGCYFINGNNLIDGRIVIKPHTKSVSLDEAMKYRKPMTINTVLVSINGTLGSVAFYNDENIILGKSVCYFMLGSDIDKHYIRRVIESPYFIKYAFANATGTTIRNLGLGAMNVFPVPLPPLAEQKRIVAKVNELMALCDTLEAKLTQSRSDADTLVAAIVHAVGLSSRNGK